MLFALKKGMVDGFSGHQRELLHLETTVEKIEAANVSMAFTDGHAAIAITAFWDDTKRLEEVDWEVIASNSWADTNNDPDRKRRKQAEFLLHEFCPWSLIGEIGVHDEKIADRVRALLEPAKHKPVVAVRSEWYY